jgi:hypothetical protein
MISKAALRGYLLEEVLAFLVYRSGYEPIFTAPPDDPDLSMGPNGLLITGRGADHQVDTLGELTWMPAFTYPTRLFVEAKFREQTTGIDTVRSLIGTLLDLNQNHLTRAIRRRGARPELIARYHYAGALFSTSGFSRPAQDLALAHGLSLIDLRQQVYDELLTSIRDATDRIFDDLPAEGRGHQRVIQDLRDELRSELWGDEDHAADGPAVNNPGLTGELQEVAETSRRLSGTHIGMCRGPFMLFLKAEDDEAFLRYCRNRPSHQVWLRWSDEIDGGGTWWITPAGGEQHAYRLHFKLPEALYSWIRSGANVETAALDAKRRYFSSITIYRREGDREELFRLKFDKASLEGLQAYLADEG